MGHGIVCHEGLEFWVLITVYHLSTLYCGSALTCSFLVVAPRWILWINIGLLLVLIGRSTHLATGPVLVGQCLTVWVILAALQLIRMSSLFIFLVLDA